MALGRMLRETREARGLSASEAAAQTRIKVQIIEDLESEEFGRVAAPIYGKGFIKLYAELLGLDPQPLIDEYVERFVAPKPDTQLNVQPMDNQKHVQALAEKPEPEEVEAGDVPESGAKPVETHAEPDLFAPRPARSRAPRRNRRQAPDALAWLRGRAAAAGEAVRTAVRTGRTVLIGLGTRASERWRNRNLSLPRLQLPRLNFTEAPLKSVSVLAGVVVLLVLIVSGLSQCARPETAERAPSPVTDVTGLRLAIELPEPYLD